VPRVRKKKCEEASAKGGGREGGGHQMRRQKGVGRRKEGGVWNKEVGWVTKGEGQGKTPRTATKTQRDQRGEHYRVCRHHKRGRSDPA